MSGQGLLKHLSLHLDAVLSRDESKYEKYVPIFSSAILYFLNKESPTESVEKKASCLASPY